MNYISPGAAYINKLIDDLQDGETKEYKDYPITYRIRYKYYRTRRNRRVYFNRHTKSWYKPIESLHNFLKVKWYNFHKCNKSVNMS